MKELMCVAHWPLAVFPPQMKMANKCCSPCDQVGVSLQLSRITNPQSGRFLLWNLDRKMLVRIKLNSADSDPHVNSMLFIYYETHWGTVVIARVSWDKCGLWAVSSRKCELSRCLERTVWAQRGFRMEKGLCDLGSCCQVTLLTQQRSSHLEGNKRVCSGIKFQ